MMKTSLSPLRKYRLKLFLGPALKLFEVACELVSPFLIRYIIDEGIIGGDTKLVYILGSVLVGLAIFAFLMTVSSQYLAARVSADYGYDLRNEIYDKMASLGERELDSFSRDKALTILSNDASSMQNGVMMFMRLIFRPPFLLIGSMILSFIINVKAGFVFMGAIALSTFIILFVMLLSPKRYKTVQSKLDDISMKTRDDLEGTRPIRAFNKEESELVSFEKETSSYKKRSMSINIVNSLINPLTFLFIDLALILIVYFGKDNIVSSIGKGLPSEITTGQIVSLIQYLLSSLAAIIMWSRMIVSLNKANASRKRIDSFFKIDPAIKDVASDPLFSDEAPLFEFHDVSFSYGEGEGNYSLQDIEFIVKEGNSIGFIGGTGSGKSTVLSLMERFYDPSLGEIFYRGKNLKEIPISSFRDNIALVSQKPAIFKGSIRNNLLIGNENATDEDLEKALKDSLAYEFVSKNEDYLEHEIEEGGKNLSGGQKQRLLIARALLSERPILILDDCTSALDYLSEKALRDNLAKRKGLTKIIVSQRVSSIKDCDEIFVFENGRIVAKGTHDELLKKSPIYKEIDELQRRQA